MAEIPPGKGSDWQERELWVLNPPSMSDRDNPRPPAGTFVDPPVNDTSVEVPRGLSADWANRDVYNLVEAGGTPGGNQAPPEPSQGANVGNPWDSMTRHDDLNGYIADEGISEPEGWTTMTIAEKKEWLNGYAVQN